MKEARIQCLTSRFSIPELGLELRQGDTVILPLTKVRASAQLEHACRIKAVSVTEITRFKDAVAPPPLAAPNTVRTGPKVVGTPEEPILTPARVRTEIKQVLQRELEPAIAKAIARYRQGLATEVRAIVDEVLAAEESKPKRGRPRKDSV